MMPPISLVVFLLGLIIGSFLNVVIYRYNTGLSVARGRSKCFQCGKTLRWYELVPLFSFIVQWGRCRGCQSHIAWQYPAVELLTGLMFSAVWHLFTNPSSLFPNPYILVPIYWAIFSLLIVILVYDLRHKIIPDGPVFAFIGLSLMVTIARSIFSPRFNLGTSDWRLFGTDLLAALILFLFFWALWYFSKGRWMGFGDAKLAVGVGLLLGLGQGMTAIVLAFWSGALVGVVLIIVGKLVAWRRDRRAEGKLRTGLTMKSEIPFAPFIIFGTAVALFYQLNLTSLF